MELTCGEMCRQEKEEEEEREPVLVALALKALSVVV